jgi:hypothetical protein
MLGFDRLALHIIVLTADYMGISHEGSSR